MINHKIDGQPGVNTLRVSTELLYGVPHGGKVDQQRYPRHVRHENAYRMIGDLPDHSGIGAPSSQRADIRLVDSGLVTVAQQVLPQHLQRFRKARKVTKPGRFGL